MNARAIQEERMNKIQVIRADESHVEGIAKALQRCFLSIEH
ncbi:hypothetical protein ACFQZ1_11405 [Bacillus sp. CGMCC 1.60114]